jgi:hypothetical protein
MGEPLQQVTLRLPAELWAEVVAIAAGEPGRSRHDVIVELIAAEVRRRRRSQVLESLAAHRRDMGPQEDSTPFIRALRDGHREA